MSAARLAAIWRDDGANMKPTASAPMATARRASSSLVIPQILTNTAVNATAGARGSPATAARAVAAVTTDSPTSTAWKPAAAEGGGVVGAADPRLGHPHDALGHRPRRPARPARGRPRR